MKPIELTDDARSDVIESAEAYERARPRAGLSFRNAVAETAALVAANPAIGAKVPRTDCRLFPMTRYDHYFVYVDHADRIEVIAVAYGKRRPDFWKRRLRRP